MMRFYQQEHPFYCGVDLHARSMYVCIVDAAGQTRLHQNIDARPDRFRMLIAPYRNGMVVGVECMFAWYWLADFCRDEQIDFVLGHALYMKAIHGGKTKNDKLDSEKIARLLRGGMLPLAYAYPREMRATRDLLRGGYSSYGSGPRPSPTCRTLSVSTTCHLWPRNFRMPPTGRGSRSSSRRKACGGWSPAI